MCKHVETPGYTHQSTAVSEHMSTQYICTHATLCAHMSIHMPVHKVVHLSTNVAIHTHAHVLWPSTERAMFVCLNWAWTDMCIDMCMDMHMDMCRAMCIDTCMDMWTDM